MFRPAWSSMQWVFSSPLLVADDVSTRENNASRVCAAAGVHEVNQLDRQPQTPAVRIHLSVVKVAGCPRLRIIPNAGVALSLRPLLLPTDCWWTSTKMGCTAPTRSQFKFKGVVHLNSDLIGSKMACILELWGQSWSHLLIFSAFTSWKMETRLCKRVGQMSA